MILAIFKNSSNLKKNTNFLSRDVLKKEIFLGGKHSWIKILLFGFCKTNKSLVIFRCSLRHSIKFFFWRWQWNFTIRTWRTFYDWSPFLHDFFLGNFSIDLRFLGFSLWLFLLLCSKPISCDIYILWNVPDSLIRCFKTRGTFIGSLLKNVKHNFDWQNCIHYQINGHIFINICIWPRYTPMYDLFYSQDINLTGFWWH